MTSQLPEEAITALDEYLALLDAALPGRTEGVYLTGSAALGDWLPGRSDLDVLVATGSLGDAELDALAELHGRTTGPHLDAVYLPADRIGADLASGEAGYPHAVDGQFQRDGFTPDPVLWATLDRHAPTVRGRAAAELRAAPRPEALRAWNQENLKSYWQPWAEENRSRLADRDPDSSLAADTVTWLVLGPGRLHHTIATGDLLAKTASADYTAALLPSHAGLLGRAKAWRLGDDSVSFTAADGPAVCDLIEAVVTHTATL